VYLSDHGLALGAHGLLGKQNLYEHSARVPLVLAGPGIPAGRRDARLAYSFDLDATLCCLCGVPTPHGIDSRNLIDPSGGARGAERDSLCAAYMDCQRMIVERRWKLILYRVDGRERVQLFDLESDPHETCSLADHPEAERQVARLRARLAAWQKACGDRWMPAVDGEGAEHARDSPRIEPPPEARAIQEAGKRQG
jgi:arylsulfatase A-like enzyme